MSDNSINSLICSMPRSIRPLAKFLRHQESTSGLSTTRYIQDVSTCLIPKAVFSRSKEDLAENTFLETTEEALIYLSPSLFGERIIRKVFSLNLDNKTKSQISNTGVELLNKADKDIFIKSSNKQVIPRKAAMALAAMVIPLCEFSLNYIKNLLTLKVFNKSDFKNIASLEHNKENKIQQEKVKKSAKQHILGAGILYGAILGLAALLSTKGKNSKSLQKLSEFIVAPGNKLFKNNEKAKNFVNKYFNMVFSIFMVARPSPQSILNHLIIATPPYH